MRVVIWVIWELHIFYSAIHESYGAPLFRDKGDWLKVQQYVKSSIAAARTSLPNDGFVLRSGEDSTFNQHKRLESDEEGSVGLDQQLSVSTIYTKIVADNDDSKVSSGDTTTTVSGSSIWDSKDDSRGGEYSGNRDDARKDINDSRTFGETDLLEVNTSPADPQPCLSDDTLGAVHSQAQREHSQFHLPRVAERAASLSKKPPSPHEEQKEYENMLKTLLVHPSVQRMANRQVRDLSRIMALVAHDQQNLPTNGAVDQVEEEFPEKFFERLNSLREKVFDLAEKIEKLKKSAGDMQMTVNELQDDSKPLLLLYNLLKIESAGIISTKNLTSHFGKVGYEIETSSSSSNEGNMNSSVETDDHESFTHMLNFFRDTQAERNKEHTVGKELSYSVAPPAGGDQNVATAAMIHSNDDINLSVGQIDKLKEFLLKINVSQDGHEDTIMNLYHDIEDSHLSLSRLRELLMQQDKIHRSKLITEETDKTSVPLLPTSTLDAAEYTVASDTDAAEYTVTSDMDAGDYTVASDMDAADYTVASDMDAAEYTVTSDMDAGEYTVASDMDAAEYTVTSDMDAADYNFVANKDAITTPATAMTTLNPPTPQDDIWNLALQRAATGENTSFSNSSKALATLKPTATVDISEFYDLEPSNFKTNLATLSTNFSTSQMLVTSEPSVTVKQKSLPSPLQDFPLTISHPGVTVEQKSLPSPLQDLSMLHPIITIDDTSLFSLSREQTTVPAIDVAVSTSGRTFGTTLHGVTNSTPPSILEGTLPPSTHKETASKVAQETSEGYHDHTILLIALLVAGLSCLMLVIGITVLCRVHRKKKRREQVCPRYRQPRYTSYTHSER
ncbi:uncharacterized protein [Procambarus clarkii]|uniref:uncharacterized protein isoform X2 n=1 Tax=Procambarus clarkii TaxID=6728 RepID=UPI001E6741A3|nr:uncharacterized protein LOC123745035 isoform X2 [Procambarus clarkii]